MKSEGKRGKRRGGEARAEAMTLTAGSRRAPLDPCSGKRLSPAAPYPPPPPDAGTRSSLRLLTARCAGESPRGLPGGPAARTPCSRRGGPGFNPWSGN